MRTLPDKAFDLAIVDPPYGLKARQEVHKGVEHNADGMGYSAYG